MKKCTWCGKEYPDDVVSCAIDHQPLQSIDQGNIQESSDASLATDGGGRPAAITGICALGFISGIFAVVTGATLADKLRDDNPAYPSIMVINGLTVIASMVGLFNMRRWGLYTYVGICVINQILKLAMGGQWDALSLVRIAAQFIVVAVVFVYWSRMK